MSLVTINTEGMTERERRHVERAERAAKRRDVRRRYVEESRSVAYGQRMALLYRIAAEVGVDDDEAQRAVYNG